MLQFYRETLYEYFDAHGLTVVHYNQEVINHFTL